MTTAAFAPLLQTGSVLLIAVAALGFLFESVAAGRRRDVAVGLLCGAFAALTVPLAVTAGDAQVDGRVPLVLIAGVLGGPLAALLAVPLPLAAGLAAGPGAALQGVLAVLLAAAVGAAVRLLCAGLAIPAGRRMILCAALASPATLAAYAVPELPAGGAERLAPLAAWTAVATLLGGILAANELARGDMLRQIRRAARLSSAAGHVPPDVLDGQLLHYWSLHERHGVDYAYLVVSIDDGAALRKRLGSARWDRLVERAGTAVRRSVRASDTCAAVDFDRFGVLLPHTTLAPALTVAERVRASLAKVGVSVSVGAADAASTGGVTDVRAASEAALYAALAKAPRGAIGPPAHALPPAKPRFFPGAEGAGDENTLLEAHEHGARKRATLEAARTTL